MASKPSCAQQAAGATGEHATAVFEEGGEYVPIGRRPEWAGVHPRPTPWQEPPVVEIARDQQFGDLMDYFWAAVEAQELSERVLALTEEIIVELNSANYTVWEWRWRCIQALGGLESGNRADVEDALARRVAHENPKNYQLWNHRRRCALALPPEHAQQELAFAAESLAFDAKNYHAWAHRQALLAAFGDRLPALWGAELALTERLLREDVRNNSAWNQRYFVLAKAPLEGGLGEPGEVYSREVDYVRSKLRLTPHNEAAWSYLRGLALLPGAAPRAAATDVRWRAACEEALRAHPSCAPALALLADVYAEQAQLLEEQAAAVVGEAGVGAGAGGDGGAGSGLGAEELGRAAGVARRLAGVLLRKLAVADPIRAPGYYRYRLTELGAGPEA